MIFETKKLQLETLSEYLSEIRTELGMTVTEVAKKIDIKEKFLSDLEQNKFAHLPADVYVFGFLKKLAQLYAIDATVLIEQYKKERAIAQQLQKKTLLGRAGSKNYFGKLVITPKFLSLVVGLLFVVGTLGYIVWQVSSINKTPSLQILQPQDRQLIHGSVVEVKGSTDPGMTVSINNQNVFVDSQGGFQTQVGVNGGPTPLVFVAANKFDKTTSRTLTVIGDNSIVAGATTTAVTLKLSFTASVSLTFMLDDATPQTVSFQAGDTKVLTANQKIIISTSDAGATDVIYNSQNIGPLGRPKEKLENVPFFPEADAVPTATTSP